MWCLSVPESSLGGKSLRGALELNGRCGPLCALLLHPQSDMQSRGVLGTERRVQAAVSPAPTGFPARKRCRVLYMPPPAPSATDRQSHESSPLFQPPVCRQYHRTAESPAAWSLCCPLAAPRLAGRLRQPLRGPPNAPGGGSPGFPPSNMRGSLLRALQPLLPGLRVEVGGLVAPMAVRGVKTTTGIVGLPVVEDARAELQQQLQAVLDALGAIPEDAEYRRSLEKTVRFKLQAAASDVPDEQLEDLLSRQVEEEIKMCREELTLIPKMAGGRWRAGGGALPQTAGGAAGCVAALWERGRGGGSPDCALWFAQLSLCGVGLADTRTMHAHMGMNSIMHLQTIAHRGVGTKSVPALACPLARFPHCRVEALGGARGPHS